MNYWAVVSIDVKRTVIPVYVLPVRYKKYSRVIVEDMNARLDVALVSKFNYADISVITAVQRNVILCLPAVSIVVRSHAILALLILNRVLPILVSSKPVPVGATLYPNYSTVKTVLHVQTLFLLVNQRVIRWVPAVIPVPKNAIPANVLLVKSKWKYLVAVNPPPSKILALTYVKLLAVNLLYVIVSVSRLETAVNMLVE